MSYEAGSVIGGIERGESAPDAIIKSDSGNPGGRDRGPDIIAGYESEDPRTERIDRDGSGGSTGPKLTKSGRIDGRTLRGKRNADSTAKTSGAVGIDKLDLTEVIYSAHAMLAGFTFAEMELDRDESQKLGDAVKNVAQYYGASFDPKKVAIFQLAMVAGGIYGVRFFAIRNRLKTERERKPPAPIQTKQAPQPKQAPVTVGAKPMENGVPFETLGFSNGDAAL